MSDPSWPFDQAPNVASITTRAVVEGHAPILQVVHYSEDDSWAFLDGGPFDPEDGRMIGTSRKSIALGTALAFRLEPPSA